MRNDYSIGFSRGCATDLPGSAGGVAVVQDRHVGQVPVEAVPVHPVPDDEDVRDREVDVVDVDLRLAALDLVHQHAHAQAAGVAGLQRPLEVAQGEARVGDVLDDDHRAPLDGGGQVELEPDDARRAGA